jgi:hypothetical protein
MITASRRSIDRNGWAARIRPWNPLCLSTTGLSTQCYQAVLTHCFAAISRRRCVATLHSRPIKGFTTQSVILLMPARLILADPLGTSGVPIRSLLEGYIGDRAAL